jgi:hypothetical protein
MNSGPGYPTDEQLKIIEEWPIVNPQDIAEFHKIMEYIKPLWEFADCGYWVQDGDIYYLHTAGWSGNEDIIGALDKNIIFWMLYWYRSERGGHYIFCRIFNEPHRKGDE